MDQTKLESLIETGTDISFGFLVSWGVWIWLIPVAYPEHSSSAGVAFGITCVFTVSSFTRRYLTRRFFARRFHLLLQEFLKRVLR